MCDYFQLVKDAVDITQVAEHYGISVNRHNKAHCPWHTDKHASLSFKNQRFKCFSCNEGGDVIELVRILVNADTPLDAVREINHAFHLGFDIDAPVPSQAMRKAIKLRKLMQERKRQFELWERYAGQILSAYFRFLYECRTTHAPQHPDDEWDNLFVESLVKLDYIEYILDEVFINGDKDTKMKFLVSHAGMIREIEQRLIKEMVPYAGRDEAFYRQYTPFTPVVVTSGEQRRKAA